MGCHDSADIIKSVFHRWTQGGETFLRSLKMLVLENVFYLVCFTYYIVKKLSPSK